jgi:protein-tyrosine phosphatase
MPHRPLGPMLQHMREAGVSVILCLLRDSDLPPEIIEDLLAAYRETGFEVVRFPVADFGVPTDHAAFSALIADLLSRLERGDGIFVHCHAGQGRTGIVLACLLRAVGFQGDPVQEIRRVYHPYAVESIEQRRFVDEVVLTLPAASDTGRG